MTTDLRAGVARRFSTVVRLVLGLEKDAPELAGFEDHLGADSLDIIELTMALEEEFSIDLDDAEVDRVVTVGEGIDLLMAHLHPLQTSAGVP